AEIQQWRSLREEGGRYFANGVTDYGESDVTPIVNRYLKEFPNLFEKFSGQKLQTKQIDVGNGYVDDVKFVQVSKPNAEQPSIASAEKSGSIDANYWNTRRVRKLPETESETLDVLEKVRSEFRAKKDAHGTLWTNHQGVIAFANAAKAIGEAL